MAQQQPQRPQRPQQTSSPWTDLDQDEGTGRRRESRQASGASLACRGIRAGVWVGCGVWTILVAAWGVMALLKAENGISQGCISATVAASLVACYVLTRCAVEVCREAEGR
jgi:hypothetical protein